MRLIWSLTRFILSMRADARKRALLQRADLRGSAFSLRDTYRQRAFFNALWSTD
jgi:hypothetical protein